jgi:hypothetical protein
MNKLNFKGNIINGEINMDITEMICIPSKPQYQEVDLCLKSGMNIVIGEIVGNSLSFDEKKKLGYEIAKRWNERIKDNK